MLDWNVLFFLLWAEFVPSNGPLTELSTHSHKNKCLQILVKGLWYYVGYYR